MEIEKCACQRYRKRSDEERKPLFNRLSRVEGQLRGIRRMLEEDAYCVDIMLQISAATKALSAISGELLKSHIKTCVVEDVTAGKTETAEELALLVERLMKS